tara:strand:- start:2936 stop:3415 length:480 start_codon:yes stop_codon:yes gene_type:complete
MTKKLEELFNLPSQDQDLEEQIVPEYVPLEQAQEQLDLAKKIDNALPQISGVDTTDQDMDIYADKAVKAFDDLMQLGYNVEDRHAGHVFAAAHAMLKNAIDAKNSKADRKLRAVELQLKKLRLDQQQDNNQKPNTIETEQVIRIDRNSLLSELSKQNDK